MGHKRRTAVKLRSPEEVSAEFEKLQAQVDAPDRTDTDGRAGQDSDFEARLSALFRDTAALLAEMLKEATPSDIELADTMVGALATTVAQFKAPGAGNKSGKQLASNRPDPRSQDKDTRSSPRRSYPYRQMVAPMARDAMPSTREFFEVRCKDISTGGVSLIMDSPPDFDQIVISLGKPPQVNPVVARVVHVKQFNYSGQKAYLVGCKFTDRLSP